MGNLALKLDGGNVREKLILGGLRLFDCALRKGNLIGQPGMGSFKRGVFGKGQKGGAKKRKPEYAHPRPRLYTWVHQLQGKPYTMGAAEKKNYG